MTARDLPLDPRMRELFDYWAAMEARPRVACPDCQFEYVEEDGHDCGEREVQT